MAPCSNILAWKIRWTEEPGRLQSMGSWRVGHDWATSLSLFTFMHWRRKWQHTPVFLPGKSHGGRSLVGCSPRGRDELDTTELLHFHFHTIALVFLLMLVNKWLTCLFLSLMLLTVQSLHFNITVRVDFCLFRDSLFLLRTRTPFPIHSCGRGGAAYLVYFFLALILRTCSRTFQL